jgi:hypothetical protein
MNMKKIGLVLVFLALASIAYSHFPYGYGYAPPERIMSRGQMSKQAMVNYLLANNPSLYYRMACVYELVGLYIREANYEGVNYEIAFAQMAYHTRYLSYQGTFVKEGLNNFAGITAPGCPYSLPYRFPSREIGVRAHIQHLKGYATAECLRNYIVDPRYEFLVKKRYLGISPTICGLSNRWAGCDYSDKIRWELHRLYRMSGC